MVASWPYMGCSLLVWACAALVSKRCRRHAAGNIRAIQVVACSATQTVRDRSSYAEPAVLAQDDTITKAMFGLPLSGTFPAKAVLAIPEVLALTWSSHIPALQTRVDVAWHAVTRGQTVKDSQPCAPTQRAKPAPFVGGYRHSRGGRRRTPSARQRPGGTPAGRAARCARRSIGARLLQPRHEVSAEVRAVPYDASRLRTKVQVGLWAILSRSSERVREFKVRSSCQSPSDQSGVLVANSIEMIGRHRSAVDGRR